MNTYYLDKLTPAKRAAQERRRAYHAKRPSHRNGKGNPLADRNQSQRATLRQSLFLLGGSTGSMPDIDALGLPSPAGLLEAAGEIAKRQGPRHTKAKRRRR